MMKTFFSCIGNYEGNVLKRGRDWDEWMPRRCILSVDTATFKYLKLNRSAAVGRRHHYLPFEVNYFLHVEQT